MENQIVSISLPVGAWNVVMNALGDRPFKEVAQLIADIKKQADAQLEQAQPEKIEEA